MKFKYGGDLTNHPNTFFPPLSNEVKEGKRGNSMSPSFIQNLFYFYMEENV